MKYEKPVYDLKELSQMVNLSIRTLREYVKSGKLKVKKIGRAYYVNQTNLSAFLDSDR